MPKSFVDVFSPETYLVYSNTPKIIAGFRTRHRQAATRVSPGDHLLCYVTKISRWVGALEVVEGPFEDNSPIYSEQNDPFVVRFKVKPIVWLTPEHGVPIQHDDLWTYLSFTRDQERGSSTWTGKLRTSLAPIDGGDAAILFDTLQKQARAPKEYPLDEKDTHHLVSHQVRREEGAINVTVPEDIHEDEAVVQPGIRESVKMQARLAELGAAIGQGSRT